MAGDIRLVIAIPSGGTWDANFAMSMIFMTNFIASRGSVHGRKINYRIHNKRGSILANMRQGLIEEAIKGDATHVLFIDSDQTFPADTFHRLMWHKKQVVACNVATKMLPSTPTARLAGGVAGVPLYTTKESTGLQEVWRVGTGVMLIDLNLFKREHMIAPWFTQFWNPKLGSYMGEDWGFCEKLEQAGVKLWVDQDLSKEIGHMGMLEYTHEAVEVLDVSSCVSA